MQKDKIIAKSNFGTFSIKILHFLRKLGLPINPRICLLLISDILAISLPLFLVMLVRYLLGDINIFEHLQFLSIILIVPIINLWRGLYKAVPTPFPQELGELSASITFSFLILTLYLFLEKSSALSRFVFILAYPICLFSLPIMRSLIRKLFSNNSWWKTKVLLIGKQENVVKVRELLLENYKLGLDPVAELHFDHKVQQNEQILQLTSLDLDNFVKQYPDSIAITVFDEDGEVNSIVSNEISKIFCTSILIPSFSLNEQSTMWLKVVEIGGHIGLQVQQNLLMPRKLLIKRCIDLTLTILSSVFILPLMLIMATIIKIDNPGPAFYKHKRIGFAGKEIWVWKFRTMVLQADQVLNTYLEANPEFKTEWEQDQKLKEDPRITRVGKILRKTSLDELPQLWNVFKGEMSLVGPRPIVQSEISKYAQAFQDYIRVLPGMTGLWQVSGRNNTTYAKRVQLDLYYISNWSIWFDIWLIARTIPVVLFRKGAY